MHDQNNAAAPLVLAIDAGGTAVKIAVIDTGGSIVAWSTADVVTDHRENGWVERDPDLFWQAVAGSIRQLLTPALAGRIVAVGCAGFGNGVFLTDANGRPTRPGIVSVDHRAQPLVDALVVENRADGLATLNGCRLWGGQTVMQLAGLAQAEPQTLARTKWALSCKDFLCLRLTGEAATDPTDASGGGLMTAAGDGYAFDLMAGLGLGDHVGLLPPVKASAGIAGHVTPQAAAETGLPVGLPVAGGMMDVAACALGAGVTSSDRMVMIAGTWAINALEVMAPPAPPLPILNMVHRDGAARLVAEGSPSSAANLGWFLARGLNGLVGIDEAMALVAACPADSKRAHFLPYVLGPKPRQGSFAGLTAADDLGSMLRAVCEAVAFQHRRHAEEILPYAGAQPPAAIRLTGGAARSAVWAQIFADVTGLPVETMAAPEVGALGAAICAAVAGGLFPDLVSASRSMCRVAAVYAPDAALRAFYDCRFKEFRRLDRGMLALAQQGTGG